MTVKLSNNLNNVLRKQGEILASLFERIFQFKIGNKFD